jgi:hypothetical protein
VDVLNALCQAKRHAAGELTGSGVAVTDRVTGRREHVHAGDRVRFIRGRVPWSGGNEGVVVMLNDDAQAGR